MWRPKSKTKLSKFTYVDIYIFLQLESCLYNTRSGLNNNNGHMHVPKPSTTCMAVTNYHNNESNINHQTEFISQD